MKVVRKADPHAGLLRQITHRFGPGVPPRLIESRCELWMSATFVGAQHRFRFERDAAQQTMLDTMRAEIGDAEFDMPDHIVADIVIEDYPENAMCFVVEALTVEMD